MFKVGEKVKINEGLTILNTGIPNIEQYVGKEAEIIDAKVIHNKKIDYRIDIDGGMWNWHENWLTVSNSEKLVELDPLEKPVPVKKSKKPTLLAVGDGGTDMGKVLKAALKTAASIPIVEEPPKTPDKTKPAKKVSKTKKKGTK